MRTWKRSACGALCAILIAATGMPAANASVDAPPSAHNTITSRMIAARSQHSATRLLDGRVLVAGGQTTGGVIFSSAEIYDPATGTWTATGGMPGIRMGHSAVLLPDGRVLVAGGNGNNFMHVAAAYLYDPASGTWSSAGALTAPRAWQTATLLPDGDVLVVGGEGSDGLAVANAERYDAASNSWSSAGAMPLPRFRHAAVRLADGRVLIHGGRSDTTIVYGQGAIYDAQSNAWTSIASGFARHSHTATLLPDGSVLVAGGMGRTSPTATLNTVVLMESTERYDPATDQWSHAGYFSGRVEHATTLLADGSVLIVGGLGGPGDPTGTFRHDLQSNGWRDAANIQIRRVENSATLLLDGTVLVAGGIIYGNTAPRTDIAELYQPTIELPALALPLAGVDQSYAFPLLALGAVRPLTFERTGGSLPGGMELTSAGVLQGAPSVDGEFQFTAQISDSAGAIASRTYQLKSGYFVTPHVIGNGSIAPTVPQHVFAGATQTFAITPGVDRYAEMGGSCAGTLANGTYTIADIQDHCSVTATFVPVAYPPDPPTITGVTPGSGSATLQFSPPLNDGGQPILYYTATATPGGFSRSCNAPCSSVTISGLTNGVAYTFRMRATNRMGASLESTASVSVTPLPAQVIAFGAPPTVHVGFTGDVVVSGGASGNPVTLSSLTPSICSVAGRVVTGIAVGTCDIAADQDGNAAYLPAVRAVQRFAVGFRTHHVSAAVTNGARGSIDPAGLLPTVHGYTRTFTVTPAAGYTATVSSSCGGELSNGSFTTAAIVAPCNVIATFVAPPAAPVIGTATAGDTTAVVTFTAPVDDGGSAVQTFTVTSTPGTVSANCSAPCSSLTVHGLGNGTAYTFRARASNAIGMGSWSSPSNSVTPKAPQIIAFGNPPLSLPIGDGTTLVASGGGSGQPVRFSSLTADICSSSGEHGAVITGIAAGTCIVAADQAGAAAYHPAPRATHDLKVFLAAAAPDAPQMISALPLDGAARITFAAPPDDGGSAILDYTAACTPGMHATTATQSPIDVGGLTNHVAYRCSVSARNTAGSGATSPALSVIPGADVGVTVADLSISKSNGTGFVDGGAPIDYRIVVSNPGPAAVIGARIADDIGGGTDFIAANWTCAALAGAACPVTEAGSGALDIHVDLPAQSSVEIVFAATADGGSEDPVSNTVSLTPPAGINDPNLANNVASDGPDLRGVFRSGFE
jgi:hypothetical protein